MPDTPRWNRIVMFICGPLAIVCVLLVGAAMCSPLLESMSEKRRTRVDAEIAMLGEHAWAGTYYRGDGLGVNNCLSVAPSAGYQFTNRGCLGFYGEEHGSVEFSGQVLELHPAHLFTRGMSRRVFRVVDWGVRRFLVEPEEMLEFVNAVNQRGSQEWDGAFSFPRFFQRASDREEEFSGLPDLPDEYAPFLLRSRIEGQITAVSGTRVDVDLGLAAGVFEGMELYILGAESRGFGTVRVREIAEHSSRGIVEYLDSFSPQPVIGWRVCSALDP